MCVTNLTPAQYIANMGGKCPVCHSSLGIEGGEMNVEVRDGQAKALQEVSCSECGSAWTDVYTLSDMEITEQGRGDL